MIEIFNDFVRNLNRYLYLTNSALFVTHHTHRPKMTDTGQKINEGDDAYFGSMLFKAWPKRVYMLQTRGNKTSRERKLISTTYRDKTGVPEKGIDLTLVEPSPLILETAIEGWSSTAWQIWHLLRDGPLKKVDIVRIAGKPNQTVYEAIGKMEGDGTIKDVNGMYERT